MCKKSSSLNTKPSELPATNDSRMEPVKCSQRLAAFLVREWAMGQGFISCPIFFARGMCSMLVAFNTFFETRDEAALFLLTLPWLSPHATC